MTFLARSPAGLTKHLVSRKEKEEEEKREIGEKMRQAR